MKDDDLPESPEVLEAIAKAEEIAKSFADMLALLGWDVAIVSVARRVTLPDGSFAAPGATGLHVHPRRLGPALDTQADALEKLAGQLREMAGASDAEFMSSYVQDKSDYASGGRQWPR